MTINKKLDSLGKTLEPIEARLLEEKQTDNNKPVIDIERAGNIIQILEDAGLNIIINVQYSLESFK